MLVLPTLILTLSGLSGAGGIALSAKSAVDSANAAATNRFVQEQNEKNLFRFEACSVKLQEALENLGKQRMVVTKNFSVFINSFEKIQNRPEHKVAEDPTIPEFDFNEIKTISVAASMVVGSTGGAVAGSALGAAAASGTKAAVIALGRASTGAKIAELHGIVRDRAALAALGGGTKAAGAGGIALGTLALNAATLGVGALVEGIALAYTGSVSKKKADEAKTTLQDNERLINSAIDTQLSIMRSVDELREATVHLSNNVYKKLVFQLKDLVAVKTDWNIFTEEERQLVDNNILMVQILNYLNNLPVYNVTKMNNKGEIEEIEPNTVAVKDAIKHAKNSTERIGK